MLTAQKAVRIIIVALTLVAPRPQPKRPSGDGVIGGHPTRSLTES